MADSGLDWSWLAPSLAVIGGSALVSNANNKAAAQARAAALQGAQIQADAIREGNAQAQATLAAQRATAAPGTTYLRNVVAEPGSLTPAQQQALNDQRLAEANTMHSTSFAGSGRAGAALLQRSDSDFVNAALDTNRQRAMTAAGELNSNATGANAGIANSQQHAAEAIGGAQGAAFTKAGDYTANAGIANAGVMGKAIGQIGSNVLSSNKAKANQDRETDYVAGFKPSTQSQTQLGGINAARPSSYDNGGNSTPRLSYSNPDGSTGGYDPSYTG